MFKARRLLSPTCVYGHGELGGADQRYSLLRRAGAFDATQVVKTPTILFVFADEHQQLANELYQSLRKGNSNFPGMESLFGIHLGKDSVARLPLRFSAQYLTDVQAASKYGTAIKDYLSQGIVADFAIVICPKSPHAQSPSPYYTSKALLAAHGIPSQIVTTDLITNKVQFDWALANIALQVFVKLGGHPWYVKPSPGGGDVVVGIGRSERLDAAGRTVRFVGYTTCYTSAGFFKSVEIFRPNNNLIDYLDTLEGSIVGALDTVLADQSDPLRLVLHVPKTFSFRERERLLGALKKVEDRAAIQYVVLRINEEHPFIVLDETHATMAPNGGVSVELDEKGRLLVLEGRPTSGNMKKAPPSPLWVTLQDSNSTETKLDALVQQIYELSVANWRGFNARARPITIHYSQLIASLLSAAESDEQVEAISASAKIRNVPWFI